VTPIDAAERRGALRWRPRLTAVFSFSGLYIVRRFLHPWRAGRNSTMTAACSTRFLLVLLATLLALAAGLARPVAAAHTLYSSGSGGRA
jgi:hypothetical protein